MAGSFFLLEIILCLWIAPRALSRLSSWIKAVVSAMFGLARDQPTQQIAPSVAEGGPDNPLPSPLKSSACSEQKIERHPSPEPNREEALEDLISSLERDLHDRDQELSHERELRSQLQVDLKEERRRVTTFETDKEMTAREIENLRRRLKELQAATKSKTAEVDRMRSTTKQLRSKLETAKREARKLEEGVKAGTIAQKELKKRLEKRLDSLSAAKDKLKSKLDASKREAKALRAKQLKTHSKKVDNSEVVALRSEVENLRSALSKRDAEALQYQQALSKVRGHLRKAGEKNASLEQKMKQERSEGNTLRMELAEVNRFNEAAVLRAKVTELQRRSKRDSGKIRELRYKLWSAEERLASREQLRAGRSDYTAFGPASISKRDSSLLEKEEVYHATPSSAKTVRFNPWVIPPSRSSRVPKSESTLPCSDRRVAEVKAFLAGKDPPVDKEDSLLRALDKATANPLDDTMSLSVPSFFDDSRPARLSWMSISSTTTAKRDVSNLEEIKALFSARDPPNSLSLCTDKRVE